MCPHGVDGVRTQWQYLLMADTIRVQIRWPRALVHELHRIAKQRHTTVSELVRQAAVEQYSLAATDDNFVNNAETPSQVGSNA